MLTAHNRGVSDRVCMRARILTVLLPGNDEQTSSARSFCLRPVFYARTKFVLQLCSCNVGNVGWKESMTLCILHLVSIDFCHPYI